MERTITPSDHTTIKYGVKIGNGSYACWTTCYCECGGFFETVDGIERIFTTHDINTAFIHRNSCSVRNPAAIYHVEERA